MEDDKRYMQLALAQASEAASECAESNGIRNSDEIIDEVCQEASMWASIAKDCGVPANMIETVSGNMQFI